MPDIDTDFDDEGRQKVIDYVVDKYGKEQVAQIVTYGTMAAKSSIKDVARVMDLPLSESNLLAKLVPDKPGTELNRCLHAPLTVKEGEKSLAEREGYQPEDIDNVKKLREIYKGNDLRAAVLHEAERLEGSIRNTGIHAAGIIIAPSDLTEIMPVATAKDSTLWVTQIEGSVIEEAGVLKMDFLGLKTLSILKTALELIKQNHGVIIDLDLIPLDDAKTFNLYQRGETNATFQFESVGMQKHLRDLKPDKFADLIAMNALYRPGPMAYIPNFIERKHGRELIKYDLPVMEEILADTYGITVYQEQVMLLSQKIASFTKGDADVLRKAMGKKQKSVLDKMKAQFVAGAVKNGHPENVLEKVWTDWEAFAQYAFNKSHSTCYAYLAYQTAYLKAHYPGEYMSAVLNHAGSIDKITFFMEECKRMTIKVLGPDINESLNGFSVNKNGEIRFGLGGLKGVGEAAIETIITERNKSGHFKDMVDFIKRVLSRSVNKKSLESLAYSGTFDCFPEYHRAQFFHVADGDRTNGLEKLINYAQALQNVNAGTTNTLFGDLPSAMQVPVPKITVCEEWTLTEKLDHEKDITGMFMSGHPLDHFSFEMRHYQFTPINDFNEVRDTLSVNLNQLGRNFKLAGLVTEVQHRMTKTGKNFGSFVIEDFTGKTDFILWSEDYIKFQNYLEVGQKIFLTGSFRNRYNQPNAFEFKITNMSLLETVKQNQTRSIEISMHPSKLDIEILEFVEKNLKQNPGRASLKFNFVEPKEQLVASVRTYEKGFLMNDDMVSFLDKHPDLSVLVNLV
jgi:DNA polymerase-3 subunit alpha